MQLTRTFLAVLTTLGMGVAQAAVVPTVDLTGLGYVTYGDANSYSLAVGNYYACGSEMGPGCPYNVKGSPGASNQDPRVYIVQGANGAASNGRANVDDAFDAVNNRLYFTMTGSNEPGSNGTNASFSGDKTGTWDATLSALNSAFDFVKNRLTFFFVNNEPNSQDGVTQNLAVWARVSLTNLSGSQTLGTWDATNDSRTQAQRLAGMPAAPGYGPPPVGGGVPLGDVTAYTSEVNAPEKTDFIMSGGQVCVNKATQVLVNCATAAPGSFDSIDHNLGANQAPYAVLFPELNAAIDTLMATPGADLSQYMLRVDLRYGCAEPFAIIGNGGNARCDGGTAVSQDNNFEQVFIGASPYSHGQVPEPMSLLLAGAGLLAAAATRRRTAR